MKKIFNAKTISSSSSNKSSIPEKALAMGKDLYLKLGFSKDFVIGNYVLNPQKIVLIT